MSKQVRSWAEFIIQQAENRARCNRNYYNEDPLLNEETYRHNKQIWVSRSHHVKLVRREDKVINVRVKVDERELVLIRRETNTKVPNWDLAEALAQYVIDQYLNSLHIEEKQLSIALRRHEQKE